MGDRIAVAREVVAQAIAGRVFPAASIDVGTSAGSIWSEAFGALTFHESAAAATLRTPFDLASLTKVIATTTILMELVRTERVRLDDPVSRFLTGWRGVDRAPVTIQDLLEHASGLAARLDDAPPQGRPAFERAICRMPLAYVPRTPIHLQRSRLHPVGISGRGLQRRAPCREVR